MATVRRASSSDAVSSTAFVISSTNSGIPSVRSMMSWRTAAGQRIVADDLIDHDVNVARRKPVEGEDGHVRLLDPGRLEFRPEGNDQQHAMTRDVAHQSTDQLEARRVRPVRIFKDHQ